MSRKGNRAQGGPQGGTQGDHLVASDAAVLAGATYVASVELADQGEVFVRRGEHISAEALVERIGDVRAGRLNEMGFLRLVDIAESAAPTEPTTEPITEDSNGS